MGEIINTTALGFEEQLIRIKQQSRKLIRIKNAFIQTTAAATPWSFIGVIEDAVEIKKIQIRSSFFQTKNKSRRIKTNESGFVDYFREKRARKNLIPLFLICCIAGTLVVRKAKSREFCSKTE